MNSNKIDEGRVRIFSKYYQFVLGSVGIALVTLFINSGLEHRQLMIDERESRIAELPILKSISKIVISDSIDTEKKILIINMMKAIVSQNSQNRIDTIAKFFVKEKNDINDLKQTSIIQLNNEAASKFKAFDKARNTNQPEADTLEKQFLAILDSIEVLKKDLNKGIIEEKALEAKLIKPKEEHKSIDNCEILNSLVQELDLSDGNYQLYRMSGFEYYYAKLLYEGNIKMLEKIDLILQGDEKNKSLNQSLEELKSHFAAWNQEFEKTLGNQNYTDSSYYRADYDGSFPVKASQNIKIQYEWVCNKLNPEAQLKYEGWENIFVLKQSMTSKYYIKSFEDKRLFVGLQETVIGSTASARIYVRLNDSNLFKQEFNLKVGESKTFKLSSKSANDNKIPKELDGRSYEISLQDTYKSGIRKYAKIKLRFIPNY